VAIDLQYGDAHRGTASSGGCGTAATAPRSRILRGADQAAGHPQRPPADGRLPSGGHRGDPHAHRVLTRDGRDRSLEHKHLGIHHPPGSKDAQILDEVAPQGDEIVITKTCGGVFNGSNIEYVLRNIGIQHLIVVGVVTSGCVEVAVRDAADRGFQILLVEDATATWSDDMQQAAMRAMDEIYAKVVTTSEMLTRLEALSVAVAR
jgi:nicotinamidase-related amidase